MDHGFCRCPPTYLPPVCPSHIYHRDPARSPTLTPPFPPPPCSPPHLYLPAAVPPDAVVEEARGIRREESLAAVGFAASKLVHGEKTILPEFMPYTFHRWIYRSTVTSSHYCVLRPSTNLRE